MTTPVPHRGRICFFVTTAALAACLVAAPPVDAQQPGADSAAQPAASAPNKAPAKGAPVKQPAQKSDSPSYSVGVSMGEQLRASGVTADMLDTAALAAGVHDAVSGKASLTDKDRDNIRTLVNSVGESNHRAAAKFLAENGKKPDIVTTASGLQYKIVNAGSGASPKGTDEVTVNYRGALINGTEFDSSYRRGQPATFPVNGVIKGWTEALVMMKPGAKWQLFVPPQLAYDLQSRPPIPPGSLLIFDVELLSVKPAATAEQPAPAPTAAPAPASKQPATPPPPK
jgi:FKBP-type peptidyl-prolyl cis-trans isomerase FklB